LLKIAVSCPASDRKAPWIAHCAPKAEKVDGARFLVDRIDDPKTRSLTDTKQVTAIRLSRMYKIGLSPGRSGNQSLNRESESLKLFFGEFPTIIEAISAELLDVPQKNRAAANLVAHELYGFAVSSGLLVTRRSKCDRNSSLS
jgi:hypothetical protein